MTYKDWLQNDNTKDVPLMSPLITKLKTLPIIAALFLGCSYFFDADLKEDAFYQNPFWYR